MTRCGGLLFILLAVACSSGSSDSELVDVINGDLDVLKDTSIQDVPDVIAEDIEIFTDASDLAEPADVEQVEVIDSDAESVKDASDVSKPQNPETSFRTREPALVGNVLVTVDSTGLYAELLGGVPIKLTTWNTGDTVLQPLGIDEGLMCWDVNKDGQGDPAKEDYNNDGKVNLADCDFHPDGLTVGSPGVVVAVLPEKGGCELQAFTLSGYPVWTQSFTEDCRQPTLASGRILVPFVTAGTGVMRLFNRTDGKKRAQVSLPQKPISGAVQVSPVRNAVALFLGVAVVAVNASDPPAMALEGVTDTSPWRPTSVFGAGQGRVGATLWNTGDTIGSLGQHIGLWTLNNTLVELTKPIALPGMIWAAPVVGEINGAWTVVSGGLGWMAGWNIGTGETIWNKTKNVGTVTGLGLAGDGKVYVGQTSWDGDVNHAPGADWRIWSYWPKLDVVDDDVAVPNEEQTEPTWWVSSPTVLCDLLVAQLVPDSSLKSSRVVSKPCASGLLGQSWARSGGNNANQGRLSPQSECIEGPKSIPCKSTDACVVNQDCDDGNPCTLDSCVSGICSYKFLPGCCTKDTHCDDFDQCTQDSCGDNGKCVYEFSKDCCESSTDCNDNIDCTDDVCEQGFCKNVPNPLLPGCCSGDKDCDDGLFCTVDSCTAQAECLNAGIFGCCVEDAECDDNSACTTDSCVDNQCKHEPTPNKKDCCSKDSDCNDDNVCTTDLCGEKNACVYVPKVDCCLEDKECDDGHDCTKDTCQKNECVFSGTPEAEGCCGKDEDCEALIKDPLCEKAFCDLALFECHNAEVDCDDGNDCTEDVCEKGECVFTPNDQLCDDDMPCTIDTCPETVCVNTPDSTLPGCCKTADECDDKDPCTLNLCDEMVGCVYEPVEHCCKKNEDCNDGLAKTTDVCVDYQCQYAVCDDFKFEVAKAPVDITFVVDQSTSMTDEIPQVRDYLLEFAKWITVAGVDYHVILVASRKKGENKICIEPPLAGPNCKDGSKFMQIDKQVGSNDSLQKIMDNYADIASFYRPNSTRHFVAITDDQSAVAAKTFNFFLTQKGGFDDFVFHSIVGFDGQTCAKGAGKEYMELTKDTGGLAFDICGDFWTGSYTQLGESTASATTSFLLSSTALPDTVKVLIKGTKAVAGKEYDYNSTTNRVLLLDPLPEPGTSLEVCYETESTPIGDGGEPKN